MTKVSSVLADRRDRKSAVDAQRMAIRGFTLIELLVTIAIGTLLMLVAVPNFVQFRRNAQLSDAVSSFIGAANTARANAMKQGINTYMVPKDAAVGWSSGWYVFADTNFNAAYDGGTAEPIIVSYDAIDSSVAIKTTPSSSLAANYLMFNGSGYPRLKTGAFSASTIELRNTARASSVVIDLAGRVRSCKTGTSTDCPAL